MLAPAGGNALRPGAKLEQLDLSSVRVRPFLDAAKGLGVVNLAIRTDVDDTMFTTGAKRILAPCALRAGAVEARRTWRCI